MYCPKCGTRNERNSSFCVNCGFSLGTSPNIPSRQNDSQQTYIQGGEPSGIRVPDYLIFSVLVTILCCWPLGLFSLYFAAKARGLSEAGDNKHAYQMARLAFIWCWITLSCGILVILTYAFALYLGYVESGDQFFL